MLIFVGGKFFEDLFKRSKILRAEKKSKNFWSTKNLTCFEIKNPKNKTAKILVHNGIL